MRQEKRIKPFLAWIEKSWMENPDLRFGQLLINMGLVRDDPTTFGMEFENYNIPHEFRRTIQTWGKYKGHYKDTKLGIIYPVYEFIYIKDLKDDHLKNIVKEIKKKKELYSHEIGQLMLEEVKWRKQHDKKARVRTRRS